MTTTIISTDITHGVVLGQGNYGPHLTISDSGKINAQLYGIYAGFYNAVVVNNGDISANFVAVDLAGGTLDNTGAITGSTFGVALKADGKVINTGTISAGSQYAVGLGDHSSLDNTGLITSHNAGVFLGTLSAMNNAGIITGKAFGVATQSDDILVNSGTISGGATYAVGLRGNSRLSNLGLVTGTDIGIVIDQSTLTNSGAIEGKTIGAVISTGALFNTGRIDGGLAGIRLSGSASTAADLITNASQGLVSSQGIGVVLIGQAAHPVSMANAGQITGKLGGVYLTNAVFTNTGTIKGGQIGVYLNGGALTNAGKISGSTFAVDLTGAGTLYIDPGAVFNGKVADQSGNGTIILGGTKAAALQGIGTSFTGFSDIAFEDRANWTVEGDVAGLASGQTITNFSDYNIGHHTIVLKDFAAADGYFAFGNGPERQFTLTNGATTHVMTFALPAGQGSHTDVYTRNGNTYLIADAYGVTPNFKITPGGTTLINTATSLAITPGEGRDALGVTIGAHGTIATSSGPAVFTPLKIKTAEIFNYGLIKSSYYLAIENVRKITNAGTIIGNLNLGILHNSGLLLGNIDADTLSNTGTIQGEAENFSLINHGLISSGNDSIAVRIDLVGQASFASTSEVIGKTYGVFLEGDNSLVSNAGHIFGGAEGIAVSRYSTVENYGSIGGGGDAFHLEFGGTIVNAGTISGGTYAIDATDSFAPDFGPALHLIAEPGAVFNGAVYDATGQAQLTLAGSTGSLDMGISFIGFDAISFAGGSTWQLEGATSDLAAGQTINGFRLGDTIVLDGFSALSDIYVKGTGLELTNGSVTVTLDIAGNLSTGKFAVTEAGGKTSISEKSAGAAVAATHHAAWGNLS